MAHCTANEITRSRQSVRITDIMLVIAGGIPESYRSLDVETKDD
jgi:hypothetical protein